MGAAGMALFVGILLVFSVIASAHQGKQKAVGLDFIAFYTAGTFVHRGMAGGMYDIAACQRFQHTLAASFGVDLGVGGGAVVESADLCVGLRAAGSVAI